MVKATTKNRIRYFTQYLEENGINTKKVRDYITQWCHKPFSKQAVCYMTYSLVMAYRNPHIFKGDK